MPAVQLTTHVKSSILYGRSYGRKSKFFRLDALLLFCIIMGLCSASFAIMVVTKQTQKISGSHIGWDEVYRLRYATVEWQKHSGQTSPHAGRFYGVRGML